MPGFWTPSEGPYLSISGLGTGIGVPTAAVSQDGRTIVGYGVGAVYWQDAGNPVLLPVPPGSYDTNIADATNADGSVIVGNAAMYEVIGNDVMEDGATNPVVWTKSGGVTVLPDLPGGGQGLATGGSGDGSIVVGYGNESVTVGSIQYNFTECAIRFDFRARHRSTSKWPARRCCHRH